LEKQELLRHKFEKIKRMELEEFEMKNSDGEYNNTIKIFFFYIQIEIER